MQRAVLLTTLILAGCAGTPGPTLDELPVRSADECAGSGAWTIAGADVALAIDTSQSTARPAGTDVDLDGQTGRFTASAMTDPGDSLLAAEVSGLRSLLRSGRYRDTRFSLVTYAGRTSFPQSEPPVRIVYPVDAEVRTGLTGDVDALESALDQVLARGSRGNTDFAAALDTALRTLDEAAAPGTPHRRLVVLISDSPTPVVARPHHDENRGTYRRLAYPTTRLVGAARRAIAERVPVYTFGLGAAADAATPHTLSRIARVTGGVYHRVGDAATLHCALLSALAR